MPELPEVETVVRTLRPRLLGTAIRSVTVHRPDVVKPIDIDLRPALIGRTITSLARRGKRIVFQLDDGGCFYIHLGMTGRLTLANRRAPLEKHTHLVARFRQISDELRFRDPRRFGGIFWCSQPLDANEPLGPEPMELNPSRLIRLLARTTRAIKSALLDQRLVAGLGNIYVDEALFRARIHPLTRSSALSAEQVRWLNRAIKTTLRRAIRHRGSTLRDYVDANGAAGGFQLLHHVYDRADEPCRSCGTRIARIVLGGRSTHFCPNCQPRDRAARDRLESRRASRR
jgi:formamidopyrimidine-DNA glycosylase